MACIVVAASDSPAAAKNKADYVCTGVADEMVLRRSLLDAGVYTGDIDINPFDMTQIECIGRHSVEWLAGNYYLERTLEIPDAMDVSIQSEGACFHYVAEAGDAIRVGGMLRCRYALGTVLCNSCGAALRIAPQQRGYASLMSIVSFTGLIGSGQRGTGLMIDPSMENVCTNRFEGTDIRDFDIGVLVGAAATSYVPVNPGAGKCDTNHFWFSYIRRCNTCICEQGNGVDSADWNVNVDASLAGSVAIRTAAKYGKWSVIMGTWDADAESALILDSGAMNNTFFVHPPLKDNFKWQDNSGNDTNNIV